MAQRERIADWDQLYPGRFFKGGDIPEGVKKVVTITDVDVEELEGDNGVKGKGILTLAGEKMQLPLNKTNGICLREMFGRKPYEWVGKRFAMFQSEWQQDPCIRIWGSPDIAQDMVITIDLGRRRKPFKMTMHAMGDEVSLRRAARNASQQRRSSPPPAAPAAEPLGERTQELLKLMALAKTFEDLMDIEADAASETFTDRDSRVLVRGLAKRRQQLDAAEAAGQNTDEGDDDADIIT